MCQVIQFVTFLGVTNNLWRGHYPKKGTKTCQVHLIYSNEGWLPCWLYLGCLKKTSCIKISINFTSKSSHSCLKKMVHTQMLNVWRIYLHLAIVYGKCRQIYHTLSIWDNVLQMVYLQVFEPPKKSYPHLDQYDWFFVRWVVMEFSCECMADWQYSIIPMVTWFLRKRPCFF